MGAYLGPVQASAINALRQAAALTEQEAALARRPRLPFLQNGAHSRVYPLLPDPDFLANVRPDAGAGWPMLFIQARAQSSDDSGSAGLWEATCEIQGFCLLRPTAAERQRGSHPDWGKAQQWRSLLDTFWRHPHTQNDMSVPMRKADNRLYLSGFSHLQIRTATANEVELVPQANQRQLFFDFEVEVGLYLSY